MSSVAVGVVIGVYWLVGGAVGIAGAIRVVPRGPCARAGGAPGVPRSLSRARPRCRTHTPEAAQDDRYQP